ncbi:MAG: class II aldolase/adducin family protein [Phycisphaeraceae bacterium]|nr:class II aldolase/adducin family protein [Phycisphaeraceae bacterium]
MSRTDNEQFDALPISHAQQETDRTTLGEAICRIAGLFAHRGWMLGGGGHLSVALRRDPTRLLITPDGCDKSTLEPSDCQVLEDEQIDKAWPQAQLHRLLVQQAGAGAVIVTQSPASMAVSEHWAGQDGLTLEGYDLLRHLPNDRPADRLWLPILPQINSIHGASERQLVAMLNDPRRPVQCGLLIRRGGSISWGQSLEKARLHAELLETLFAATVSRNALK